jgi:hypothetical protein
MTDKKLKPENMPELLQNLIHSQAALQCYFNQDFFDIVIPVYLGNSASDVNGLMMNQFGPTVRCVVRTSSGW